MVGLADLKKHLSNVKQCHMALNDKYCYFSLSGVNTLDFLDILNYKSWVFKTFQKIVNIRYIFIVKKLQNGNTIVRTSVGFAPLLLRYLRIKGYNVRDEDIDVFKARHIIFPEFKINLYDFQIRMINDWKMAGSIGVLKSPTGSGKTIIGCSAIKEIGRKTLILVHTSDLLINVWNDSLVKSFGPGIMGQVGIIGGGLTDKDRANMRLGVRSGDFDENVRKDIVIATFQTLMNRLDELTQYKFGLMVVDECHHCPAQMFRKVNAVIRAPYKLGLSATIDRLDGMTRDVFGQLGDVQSKVSIRELINRGILAEPRFQSPVIVDHEIIGDIQDSGLSGLNYSRMVKKKSAASQKKKDYVVNICRNIAARDRKFLLFTDYVNAEDVFVRDMYADSLLKEGTSVSVIDQGMTSDERSSVFNFLETGEISGIVFGKLGSEGVNIPSVDVVVMANAIKSPITFTQRVGRAMRRIPGKDWCDVYEVLLDLPTESRWSDFNFAEYRAEGFQKLAYKVE